MNELEATSLLNSLRVVSDAANAEPGKPVGVSLLPPAAENLLPDLAQALQDVFGVALEAKFTVVDKDGASTKGWDVASGVKDAWSGVLGAAFLLLPNFGDEVDVIEPANYVIRVDVRITVDGHKLTSGLPPQGGTTDAENFKVVAPTIEIPVTLPGVSVPAVCLLSENAHVDARGPGQVLVMVRAVSNARSVDAVFAKVNSIMSLLSALKTVLEVATPTETIASLLPPLETLSGFLGHAPIVWFSANGSTDFHEFGGAFAGLGGFDNKASAILLFGPIGTRFRLYSATDWDTDTGIEGHEYSDFVVSKDVLAGLSSLKLGFGFRQLRNFDGVAWFTDQGSSDDMQDSSESGRFFPNHEKYNDPNDPMNDTGQEN